MDVLLRCLSACCLSAVCTAATVAEQVGINIHVTDPKPGELEQLAAVGAGWVRMDVSWQQTEKAPGVFDFAAHDRLLAALDRQRIRAVLILAYGNPLYDGGGPPVSDAGRRAFATWAAAAATRLQGHGVLWEIWNEPNSRTFWRPAPDVAAYAALTGAATAAIHAAAPAERVLGPATSHVDMAFLEGVCDAGLLESWSGLTVHPYREASPPETAAEEYRRVRALIRQRASPGREVPVLSGEWGYADVWKGFDVQRQARYLARMWLSNIAEGVPLSIWYDWRDDGRSPSDPENHFGMVRWQHFPDAPEPFEPKPAYRAAQTLLRELGGFTFTKRLAIGGPEDHVLLFARGAEQRLAVWTRRVKPEALRLPLAAGPVRCVGLLGAEGVATASADGLGLVPDGDVRYLTPVAGDALMAVAAAWEAAPPEWVLPAGKGGEAVLRLRNPLPRAIRILPGSGTAGGEVAPGGEHVWRLPVVPSRDGEPTPLRFVCAVDGLGSITQGGMAVAADPLLLTAAPGPDGIAVRIGNPACGAVAGRIEAVPGGSVPLAMAAGRRTADLVVPASGAGPWRVLLHGADGAVALERQVAILPLALPGWQAVADGDARIAAEATLAAGGGGALAGQNVLSLTWRTAAGSRFFRIAPRGGPRVLPGRPAELSLWLRSTGTAPALRLRFRDAAGQTFQPEPRTIAGDPAGWHLVAFRLDGIDTWRWGGPDDGIVRWPVQLDTLLLVDAERAAGAGTVEVQAPATTW